MSPTILCPGAWAVKSRFTRSGIGPAWHAEAVKLRMPPPVAVGAVGILEGLGDEQLEFLSPFRGRRGRPTTPFIKSGPGHLKPCAHLGDRWHVCTVRRGVGCVLRVDE